MYAEKSKASWTADPNVDFQVHLSPRKQDLGVCPEDTPHSNWAEETEKAKQAKVEK